ncbi:SdpA family antimicrobial peptide system protein [Bacillus sp. JJ1764]|uniref:SdpA family antimicrobial peptide system protein n=1 Tax=Bacillus sp. JJ1764 TaxID=3122964 RepID=UPI0030000D85
MGKKAISVFIVFSTIWGFIFSSSVVASLGTTPIPLSKDSKIVFASMLPQGWGFFSKSPRDMLLGIHTANEKSLKVLFPTMRFENLLGLYRKGRSQGVEMGALSVKISKEDWVKCDGNDLKSCEKSAKKINIENKTPSPLLCGEYYFTHEEIIPWSYYKYSLAGTEVKQIVKADIQCSKQ